MPFSRQAGSTRSGGSFSDAVKRAVFNKGRVVPGWDASRYRADACGYLIDWHEYGNTTRRGWEIDHIMPVAKGGTDDLINLQPLQWYTNRHKADNVYWSCPVAA